LPAIFAASLDNFPAAPDHEFSSGVFRPYFVLAKHLVKATKPVIPIDSVRAGVAFPASARGEEDLPDRAPICVSAARTTAFGSETLASTAGERPGLNWAEQATRRFRRRRRWSRSNIVATYPDATQTHAQRPGNPGNVD